MYRGRTIWRYLWAAPATAVGLLLAAVARSGGATAAIADGVLEVAGGRLGRGIEHLPRAMRFSAITLGHVVIAVDRHALARCRRHERVHVRQYERWGIFFFPLYAGSSVLQLLRGRSPYWDNHFEREAYREERRREADR